MGERLLCKQEVVGSIPSASTSFSGVEAMVVSREIRQKETQHGNVSFGSPQAGGLERDHGQCEDDC